MTALLDWGRLMTNGVTEHLRPATLVLGVGGLLLR